MMESRLRASGQQFATLLEFMECHGDLAKPQLGAQGRLNADRLWLQLVTTLNSIRGGVNKTLDKWKKVWADWKSKTKKKALLIRRRANGTCGGPNSQLALTNLEERVLRVIGALVVEENSTAEETEEQGSNRSSIALSHHVHLERLSIAPPQEEHLSMEINIEDETISPSASPPLPSTLVLVPSHPSSSWQQLLTPTPAWHSPPVPTNVPAAPPTQPVSVSPSFTAVPHRRRRLAARRKRALTSFKRATREFVLIEQRRLRLEEQRERNKAKSIEIDQERNVLLSRFADIAEKFLQQYLQEKRSD